MRDAFDVVEVGRRIQIEAQLGRSNEQLEEGESGLVASCTSSLDINYRHGLEQQEYISDQSHDS